MTNTMKVLIAVLVLCLLGGLPAALRAQTPWYVAYEKGLKAQELGDWKGSIPLLKEALAERSAPKVKAKTYGLRFINYLPYFHLGEAYFKLKEKQKALENFDLCVKYGEIQNAPEEYARLQELRQELTGVAAKPTAEAPPIAAEATVPARMESPAGLPWYVNYETALAYIESGDWLKAIDNLKLALAANGIPRRYARTYGMWFVTYIPYYYLGVAYYNQGLWQFAVSYFETSERLGEVKGLETESDNLKALLADAKKRGAGVARRNVSEELREVLNMEITEAIQLFNQAEYAKAEPKFRAVLQLDPYNSVAKSYLVRMKKPDTNGQPEGPVQKDFSAGVLNLLKGRHEKAIVQLTAAKTEMDQDASLHGYLGVAYFLRYRSTGKKDAAALRSARQEFRRALALDPSYQLDRTVFSRDVIDAFQNVRKGG
jgi:tetratricopeptide (TPR) repeat protein